MKIYVLNKSFKLLRSYYNNSKKQEKDLLKSYYNTITETEYSLNNMFYLKYYKFFTKVYEDKIAVMLSWVIVLRYVSVLLLLLPYVVYLTTSYVSLSTNIFIGLCSLVIFLYHIYLKRKTDTELMGYIWEKTTVEQSLQQNSFTELNNNIFS